MAIMGTYGIALAHLMMALAFSISPSLPFISKILSLSGIVFYFYVFGMTYGPILWIWLAEAIQPKYLGYTVMANWLGAALTSLAYPTISANTPNKGYIFMFFSIASILCLPIINKLMIETKDKSEDMIGEEYAKLDRDLWGT